MLLTNVKKEHLEKQAKELLEMNVTVEMKTLFSRNKGHASRLPWLTRGVVELQTAS